MTKKLLMGLMAFLVAGTIALAAEKSYTGVVSDSHCGLKHSTPSDAAAECVKKCVSGGGKYVLVSRGKLYNLDPQDKFADFAGKRVKVIGTLSDDTVKASSVTEAAAGKKAGEKKKSEM